MKKKPTRCTVCGRFLSKDRAQVFEPVANVESGPSPQDLDCWPPICERCEFAAQDNMEGQRDA